ncbi:hypothetical protein ACFFJY_02930 [Fictibacillus aquaticus]|uniref:Uncharacterized protein n=1 Tax=Fictibacillus aquaticus TaxID=2021314 RepID=A0A235F9F8_9BACL|nr:hypothetical protein [Fictibacillus aquaticus]OYD57653.1 hypothetical protein CGZ90_13390 [Fictibacillus aquaticus]
MDQLETIISNYTAELEERLARIQKVHRENVVEEVKDHLYSFVQDYKSQGLTDAEIEEKIQQEFLSMDELAEGIMSSSPKNSLHHRMKKNYTLILPLIAGSLGIFAFPDHQELLIALMLFIYSYLVVTKKMTWGFAAVRKNPGRVKHHEKVSQLGSIYLFLLGMVFIIGQFVTMTNENLIFLSVIVFISLSFFFYINRMLAR